MKIRLTVSGRDYHATGGLPAELELPEGADISAAIQQVEQLLPDEAKLPPTCLIAVSGSHLGTVAAHASRSLREGDEVSLIAPVAGG